MTTRSPAEQTAGPTGRAGLEPVRDPRVTLVDLVDTLLDRGLYLNLDVIISVADIPLIGLNLRATLAGMETMLEYGMMRDWDQRTRAWVQRTSARDLPLEDDEELLAKMAGGYFHDDGFHRDWRPGSVYLTTHRVLVFRRDPREVLWQTSLESIRSLAVRPETTVGGEKLDRLHLLTEDDDAVLSASAPRRLGEMVLQQAPSARRELAGPEGDHARPAAPQADETSLLVESHLWYREDLAGRSAWRGGTGRLDEHGFTWKNAMDARPAIRLRPGELSAVHLEDAQVPSGESTVMRLETVSGEIVLSGDLSQWRNPLQDLAARVASDPHGKEPVDGPRDR
ncbi:gas vesicle protein [Brachybacterium sacelli]|uniref:Gas vesicle protein n=1 Tax=Brachybacterium sacelli TaxID=173364 RepID=A0ABS4WZH0_9MICO|nr:gas vesicle protein [Brachybacterium sacelli]MBP2381607.1 hypothetical protein [Brachybacterium sacelli]